MKKFFKNEHTRHLFRHALGWVCFFLGIIGCFLPFLQGILLIAVGIGLLADYIPWFARLRNYLHKRFPRAHEIVESMKRKAKEKRMTSNKTL